MDGLRSVNPQFNVHVFNKIVQVTMNFKFAEDLVKFLNSSPQMAEDFDDLIDGIEGILSGQSLSQNTDADSDYNLVSYGQVITMHMDSEFATFLHDALNHSTMSICKSNCLNLSIFVAFTRKLYIAAIGDYETLARSQVVHHMPPMRGNFGYIPRNGPRKFAY